MVHIPNRACLCVPKCVMENTRSSSQRGAVEVLDEIFSEISDVNSPVEVCCQRRVSGVRQQTWPIEGRKSEPGGHARESSLRDLGD